MSETFWTGMTPEEWLTYNPQPPSEWMDIVNERTPEWESALDEMDRES